MDRPTDPAALVARIRADLLDGYDEGLEMEIEDRSVDAALAGVEGGGVRGTRLAYFQAALHAAARARQAAGLGGRDAAEAGDPVRGARCGRQGWCDQAHHAAPEPRVCRVVALPAPNDREKTQWYFQRCVPHLPARERRADDVRQPVPPELFVPERY